MNNLLRSDIPQETQDLLDKTLKYWRIDYEGLSNGFSGKGLNRRYRLWVPNDVVPEMIIADFSLTEMPGCCGVLISHASNVIYSYRRRGIGKALHKLRIALATKEGYTILMCTDVTHNTPQQKILNSNGWKTALTFKNKRTSNDVNVSIKIL